MRKSLICILVIACFGEGLIAQNPKLCFDLHTGLSYGFTSIPGSIGLVDGAGLRYCTSKLISFEASMNQGTISGSQKVTHFTGKDLPGDFISFDNRFRAVNLDIQINLNHMLAMRRYLKRINPYLAIGGGRIFSDAIAERADHNVKRFNFSCNQAYAGLNLRYYINYAFDLSFSFNYTLAQTYFLDAIHKDKSIDFYAMGSVGINFKIGATPSSPNLEWENVILPEKKVKVKKPKKENKEDAKITAGILKSKKKLEKEEKASDSKGEGKEDQVSKDEHAINDANASNIASNEVKPGIPLKKREKKVKPKKPSTIGSDTSISKFAMTKRKVTTFLDKIANYSIDPKQTLPTTPKVPPVPNPIDSGIVRNEEKNKIPSIKKHEQVLDSMKVPHPISDKAVELHHLSRKEMELDSLAKDKERRAKIQVIYDFAQKGKGSDSARTKHNIPERITTAITYQDKQTDSTGRFFTSLPYAIRKAIAVNGKIPDSTDNPRLIQEPTIQSGELAAKKKQNMEGGLTEKEVKQDKKEYAIESAPKYHYVPPSALLIPEQKEPIELSNKSGKLKSGKKTGIKTNKGVNQAPKQIVESVTLSQTDSPSVTKIAKDKSRGNKVAIKIKTKANQKKRIETKPSNPMATIPLRDSVSRLSEKSLAIRNHSNIITPPFAKYNVIVGVFKSRRYAFRFKRYMESKGFEAYVFRSNPHSKMLRVAIYSGNSRLAALKELYKTRKNTEPMAWIHIYRT